MHVLLIVFGVLLLLFGGGCSVFSAGILVQSGNVAQDVRDGWWVLVFGCLAPLLFGWWMFRRGLAIDRMKRKAGQTPPGATQ